MKKENSILISIDTFDELKVFANAVTKFKSDVNIYNNSDYYDAKSIMAVLALSLGKVRYVEIVSNNEEEIREFKKLMKLFEAKKNENNI